ncbi:MAG: hypothetical protein CMQ11_07270, partial [Gammaproteobacteria bacterium]|nr:hypothetical protein [Gammaproteobacteria bacterium]
IAGRGPLIVAPRGMPNWFQNAVLQTNARVRIFALVLAVVAAGLVLLDFGDGLIPSFFYAWGWLTAAVAIWALLFPSTFRRFYNGVMVFMESSVDDVLLRGAGVLGVIFGLWMIYFGIEVI